MQRDAHNTHLERLLNCTADIRQTKPTNSNNSNVVALILWRKKTCCQCAFNRYIKYQRICNLSFTVSLFPINIMTIIRLQLCFPTKTLNSSFTEMYFLGALNSAMHSLMDYSYVHSNICSSTCKYS